MELGQKIRTLRKAKSWSQRRLAAAIGKTDGYITQIERGQANPTLSTIEDIADALEVRLSILLESGPVELEPSRKALLERIAGALPGVSDANVADFSAMVLMLERWAANAAAADVG